MTTKTYDLHIAPDKSTLHNPETGERIEFQPNQITIEFWDKNNNYEYSKPLDELTPNELGRL